MKIRKVDFYALRNNEHFQCQTEFKALVIEFNPDMLKINPLFNDSYLPQYNAEDEALVKIVKNTFTTERIAADRQRDMTYRGMADTLKGALNHFDPEIHEAARRLTIVFDTYGNVAKLPLNEESSAIYNLIQDLRMKYVSDTNKLNLTSWIDQLDIDNKAYEQLVMGGYEEEATKTELKAKTTRTDIDNTVRLIIERIEALMVVEGEANYAEFVRRLNIQFDKYANTLAQRKGAAAAKKIKN